ncbi:MAG: hypothetical protein WC383_18350 [Gammaproteobacteria bacterium]
MDRAAVLSKLTDRLNDAVAARDWDAVAAVDGTLAKELPTLVAQGAWSAAEREAFARLRQAHRKAMDDCGVEVDWLQERLRRMRVDKEGWLAYAENGELDEGRDEFSASS